MAGRGETDSGAGSVRRGRRRSGGIGGRTAVSGYLLFFFQAEDGIRHKLVTGVQTCALPIFVAQVLGGDLEAAGGAHAVAEGALARGDQDRAGQDLAQIGDLLEVPRRGGGVEVPGGRSEERRVGKEGSSGRWAVDEREKREGG